MLIDLWLRNQFTYIEYMALHVGTIVWHGMAIVLVIWQHTLKETLPVLYPESLQCHLPIITSIDILTDILLLVEPDPRHTSGTEAKHLVFLDKVSGRRCLEPSDMEVDLLLGIAEEDASAIQLTDIEPFQQTTSTNAT
jgi:hypothetical protein